MNISSRRSRSAESAPSAHWLARYGHRLGNLLLPPACLVCQTALDARQCLQICHECQLKIANPEMVFQCCRCAARSKFDITGEAGCRFCVEQNMPFASVTCLGNYESLLRELVIRMKGARGQEIAIQLGRWLGQAVSATLPTGGDGTAASAPVQYLTSIPGHWTRRLGRGPDVAGILTESIGRIPEFRGRSRPLLVATRKTRKQGTLTMAQRFENVKNCFAFAGKPNLESASILLVDDVMTSGATAIQAARVLQRAGARQVHLAFVARGVGQGR